jgi:hypothetical protein
MTKPRIPSGLDEPWPEPDDAGLGNIQPEETVGLDPDDAGLGNIRPEETVGLDRRPEWFWSWMGRHWFGRSLR